MSWRRYLAAIPRAFASWLSRLGNWIDPPAPVATTPVRIRVYDETAFIDEVGNQINRPTLGAGLRRRQQTREG